MAQVATDPAQGSAAGTFLITDDGPGSYQRETVTLLAGAGPLPAGRLLGKITASGKYKNYDDAAVDGTQTAVAILYAPVLADAADAQVVVIVRHANCRASEVSAATPAHKAAGLADLEAITVATNVGGIRFR